MKLAAFTICVGLLAPAAGFAQEEVPVERYSITHTDDLRVIIEMGNDGARGGNQVLLLFQMQNGSTRKFDLNRSREEWGGNSTRTVQVTVQPPITYADVTRIGIEWHGSHGDAFQEQDDADLKSLAVWSRAAGSPVAAMNGRPVRVAHIQNVRLENDQTFWHGAIRPAVQQSDSGLCTSDAQCDDRIFCNGVERCDIANPAASRNGCVAGPAPCSSGQLCDETADRCSASCVDSDGDGHLPLSCGGDDCDDNDANRYPGNVEILDSADHDEDCDVNTHGYYRGAASSQICDGPGGVVLVDPREQFTRARCVTGTVCVQQPNGEGVCMVEPAGYQPPTRATAPTGPQQAPPASGGMRTISGSKPTAAELLRSPDTSQLNVDELLRKERKER